VGKEGVNTISAPASILTLAVQFRGLTANSVFDYMWSDNKIRELVAVKVLPTTLLNLIVVVFKVLPLKSYAPTLAPSPPFKTILELVLSNDLQSCRRINPDVIGMPSFQYFLYLREQEKLLGLDPVNREGSSAELYVY
jgi:hypothetical protein